MPPTRASTAKEHARSGSVERKGRVDAVVPLGEPALHVADVRPAVVEQQAGGVRREDPAPAHDVDCNKSWFEGGVWVSRPVLRYSTPSPIQPRNHPSNTKKADQGGRTGPVGWSQPRQQLILLLLRCRRRRSLSSPSAPTGAAPSEDPLERGEGQVVGAGERADGKLHRVAHVQQQRGRRVAVGWVAASLLLLEEGGQGLYVFGVVWLGRFRVCFEWVPMGMCMGSLVPRT